MTEEHSQEAVEEVKAEIQQEVKEEAPNDKEINFSNLRNKIKEKDDQLSERERQLHQMQRQIEELQKPVKAKEPEDEYGDDDYTPRKTVRRDAEEIADKKIREYEEKNWKRVVKADYNDFDNVVTNENIKMLEEQMPEISELIMRSGNKIDMAAATYKAIKRLQKINSPSKEIEENRRNLEKNKDKPMSTAAVDKRPIAQVAKYSDSEYQELWKEMTHYASKA